MSRALTRKSGVFHMDSQIMFLSLIKLEDSLHVSLISILREDLHLMIL